MSENRMSSLTSREDIFSDRIFSDRMHETKQRIAGPFLTVVPPAVVGAAFSSTTVGLNAVRWRNGRVSAVPNTGRLHWQHCLASCLTRPALPHVPSALPTPCIRPQPPAPSPAPLALLPAPLQRSHRGTPSIRPQPSPPLIFCLPPAAKPPPPLADGPADIGQVGHGRDVREHVHALPLHRVVLVPVEPDLAAVGKAAEGQGRAVETAVEGQWKVNEGRWERQRKVEEGRWKEQWKGNAVEQTAEGQGKAVGKGSGRAMKGGGNGSGRSMQGGEKGSEKGQ